jgi:hypothetical protein
MPIDQPWVRLDIKDDNESSIIGNIEGLTHLREKIDDAIQDKHAMMEEFDCNFSQIRLADDYPIEEKTGLFVRLLLVLLLLVVVLGTLTLAVLVYSIYNEFWGKH